MSRSSFRVLFVCLGNICRSPMAEGFFQKLLESTALSKTVDVDSAATARYNLGQPPDPRAIRLAASRKFDISGQRARHIKEADFEQFDLILAMDRSIFRNLVDRAPQGYEDRVKMLMEYAPDTKQDEVPDPYYGEMRDFEFSLSLIEAGCRGLLEAIQKR